MSLRARLSFWWRRACGYTVCPLCGAQAVRWHRWPGADDAPPLLQYWACEACGARTEEEFTPLMDKAARSLGYKDAKTLFDSKRPGP